MKNGFLMGLAIGLALGFALGLATKHFLTLLFIGVALVILLAASRVGRHKFLPPRAAGQ
jgi:uncharacterized membrane protein (Fun14 family)